MITCKDWYILLVLVSFCLPSPLWAFSFSLSKQTISLGETAVLRIDFSEVTQEGNPLILDELLNQAPKLKILERNLQRGENSLSITFEITSYFPGDYRIPPVQVKWGSDTFSTEALELKVTTTRAPEDMEIRPDFGALKTPFPWRKAFFWVITSAAGLLSFWIIRWTLKRIPWNRLKRMSWNLHWPSLETDRMWLKKELARLRKQLKAGESGPELVDQIFHSLGIFLQKKTHTPVPALTSLEIEKKLGDHRFKPKMAPILRETDYLKYQSVDKKDSSRIAEELLTRIEKDFL